MNQKSFLLLIQFCSILIRSISADEHLLSSVIFSDCKHLILPQRCQCYHSADQSQLRCHNIQLYDLPKLPNNMRWFALDFSLNNITSIESYAFSEIYVEKLYFHSNLLNRIDPTGFNFIENLKELYLNQNRLTQFSGELLLYPGIQLEILDLSENPLKFVDLGEILLNSHTLKRFRCRSCFLDNFSLETLLKYRSYVHEHLESIDLSSNRIVSLCDDYWSNLKNLREIRLEKNEIFQLDGNSFQSLDFLRSLNLAENLIEHFPKLFSRSLEFLNVSSNRIDSLEDSFGVELRKIRSIDFDSNPTLETIRKSAFCGLELEFLENLSFRRNNLSTVDSFEEIFCRSREKKRRTQLIDVDSNIYLKCDCFLVVFKEFFVNYSDLTCVQQGHDRYFISKLAPTFSHCVSTSCNELSMKNFCSFDFSANKTQRKICEKQILIEPIVTTSLYENFSNTSNGTATELNISNVRRFLFISIATKNFSVFSNFFFFTFFTAIFHSFF